MRRLTCWLMVLLAFLAAGVPQAWAQATLVGEVLNVGLGGSGGRGLYRLGQWVPVRVRLENRSGQRFVGHLAVQTQDLDGDRVMSVGRQMIVEAGPEPRDFWFYYWPQPNDNQRGISEVVVLNEGLQPVPILNRTAGADMFSAGGVLRLPENLEPTGVGPEHDGQSQRLVLLLGPSTMGLSAYINALGGTAKLRIEQVANAAGMPDDALGLDGVDIVIWEADHVRGSELPAGFQRKALLDWVRAGGHLVITAGSQWNELMGPDSRLAEALPLKPEKTVELADAAVLSEFAPLAVANPKTRRVEIAAADWGGQIKGRFSQMVGQLKAGARTVSTPRNTRFAPLVVTGAYGAGAVTVVTMDLAAAEFQPRAENTEDVIYPLPPQWVALWQKVFGWTGEVRTEGEFKRMSREQQEEIERNPTQLVLDTGVADSLDFQRQTAVRLLLAVLFLGLYWLAAGPGSHLALRQYRLTHWSWWIFGGMVVLACLAAILVVGVFRIRQYDMKHRSFVLGTAGESEVAVVSYYGVFAPTDGNVKIRMPEASGLAYLAPLNVPQFDVQSYADPQSYYLYNESPAEVAVPFRSTLKKLQGRWVGATSNGINARNVDAVLARRAGAIGSEVTLSGELVNSTGYDLYGVEIVVALSEDPRNIGSNQIFDVGMWKAGDTLNLAKGVRRRRLPLSEVLVRVGRQMGVEHRLGGAMAHMSQEGDPQALHEEPLPQDLLNVLLDWRDSGSLQRDMGRTEFTRHLTRLVDRSKSLRAGRMLVLGRAGNAEHGVASPVPLVVNGRELKGSGEVLFAWVVPLK